MKSTQLRFDGWLPDVNWAGENYRYAMCQCAWALAPSGWNPQSPRLIDALLLGVPSVIVAAGLHKPFVQFVNWDEFTLSCVAHCRAGRPRGRAVTLAQCPRN